MNIRTYSEDPEASGKALSQQLMATADKARAKAWPPKAKP